MSAFISASDDKTQSSAEKFMRDMENGKISAIGESAFFEGIKVQSVPSSQNYMTQFIDLEQYLKASCWNEIGLNSNYNMKREYIGNAESALNDDLLLPLVDNMIKERQTAIDKINEKYGTEITIDFASSWKVTHMENEKEVAISQSVVGDPDILNIQGGDDRDTDRDDRHSESPEPGNEGLIEEITSGATGDSGNEEDEIHEPVPREPSATANNDVTEQDDTSEGTGTQEESGRGDIETDGQPDDDEDEEEDKRGE